MPRTSMAVISLCLALASSACDDAHDAPSRATTAVVELTPIATDAADVCWAVAIRDASGATVATRGTPGPQPTRGAALASGAACGPGALRTAVELACTPGDSWVLTWFVGAYDAAGASTERADPCGADGCLTEFVCVDHAATPVAQSFLLMRDANQGFVDVSIRVPDPGDVEDLCGTLRMVDGAGELLWVQDICASELGNGRDEMTFVGLCVTEPPDGVLTLWLDPPVAVGGGVVVGTNPCLGPTDAADPLTWSGGCSLPVTCRENEDALVTFDFRVP